MRLWEDDGAEHFLSSESDDNSFFFGIIMATLIVAGLAMGVWAVVELFVLS